MTRHLSVAYWKGGDAEVEDGTYRPENVEKIVAWGGIASITHIAKYIQPGIDFITLDPKLRPSIIGREAFRRTMGRDQKDAARTPPCRTMWGARNQEACHCARVVYIETGTDAAALRHANRFGEMLLNEIRSLPVSKRARARPECRADGRGRNAEAAGATITKSMAAAAKAR